ncbi:MAG: amidohydrolase [Chloroflexi bacterium HGW-Chloroflexi-5]|jgi:5-methylthioadenosine/S-adenosylhomocysteine deaminase|nr:MAG: amidohydrolase [Chloroflexi bacterium HGW-Chloroflexi-5]
MTQADLILKNAIILTMDLDYSQYDPGAIAIQGNSIVAVGAEKEILAKYTAEKIIDCDGKVLMPGLVNAHTHVPMNLLRGLADDLRLDVWLMGYMMPVEREFVSKDFVTLGTQLACAEMIRSGVTTFADMYYFEEDIAKAAADIGMRALCSQSVMKYPTPDAQFFEQSLEMSRDFISRWKGHELIIPSVAPHAPYTCPPEILKAAAALAVEFDVPLHTHLSETAFEVENMRKENGMPVIPYVKKQNLFDAKVLAAHCVHVDDGEIRTMQHFNVGVAHNPSSNLKLASGVAPISRMLELGLNVGIGTDGAASNNDLDMFEEIRLTSFLQKGFSGDPTTLPARQALLMGTRLGAQAMHIGHLTGSLEAGKRADLILVDISPLHNSPQFKHNPQGTYAQIVYAAKASDVTDVMVNGKWLMQKNELLNIDEDEIRRNSQEYARKIDTFLIQRESSVLSKLVAIGGAAEEESFEIQIKVRIKDTKPIYEALQNEKIEILRKRHYREFDIYFFFKDPEQGILRYREDEFLGPENNIEQVRSRLTLIGQTIEGRFPQEVLLSRSRYMAAATQSPRFYREYFKPQIEKVIEKDRIRFLIKYEGFEFFINIDEITKPHLGFFLEVKSRTWSRQDAELKSTLVTKLIEFLGGDLNETTSDDYIEMVK